MHSFKICLIVLASVWVVSMAQQKRNSTVQSSSTERVSAKSARSEFHPSSHHGGGFEHHFPHHYGGHVGGYGHYKELDHYLLPILVVLGLGVLVLPMIGVLMTTLVGNVPVTTLVSGRRKRDLTKGSKVTEEKIVEYIKKFSQAFDAFNKPSN